MSTEKIVVDMLAYEKEKLNSGCKLIAGIDEAGRGPLAGVVSVACCIMDLNNIIPEVNDSKKLSEKKRNKLYDLIIENAIAYKCVFVDEKVIDEINILNATKKGMKEALDGLAINPDFVLVDAVKYDFGIPSQAIIKGDALSYTIACASIIAKVTRDRYMLECAKLYPEYGFEKHKGYGTKVHIEKLKEIGPCPIHRKTFIKNFF